MLANRREIIKQEIVRYVEHARKAQVQAILQFLRRGNGAAQENFVVCLVTLLTCISRVLITEEAVGIGLGHAQTRAFVEWVLQRFLVSEPTPDRTISKSPNEDLLNILIRRFATEAKLPDEQAND